MFLDFSIVYILFVEKLKLCFAKMIEAKFQFTECNCKQKFTDALWIFEIEYFGHHIFLSFRKHDKRMVRSLISCHYFLCEWNSEKTLHVWNDSRRDSEKYIQGIKFCKRVLRMGLRREKRGKEITSSILFPFLETLKKLNLNARGHSVSIPTVFKWELGNFNIREKRWMQRRNNVYLALYKLPGIVEFVFHTTTIQRNALENPLNEIFISTNISNIFYIILYYEYFVLINILYYEYFIFINILYSEYFIFIKILYSTWRIINLFLVTKFCKQNDSLSCWKRCTHFRHCLFL